MHDIEPGAATPPTINPLRARDLTDRIKVAVEGTWQLIKEAYTTRAWSALGYDSWDDYCSKEFGATRLKLPREERQEVVGSLRDAGLSTRAIAAATGMNRETARQEVAAIEGDKKLSPGHSADPTPSRSVTGTDGRIYPVSLPSPGMGDFWEPSTDDTALPTRQDEAERPPAKPAPRPRVDVTKTVMRALADIDKARRSLEALTPTQLGRQDEEARRLWASNLLEQVEALTDFHANL